MKNPLLVNALELLRRPGSERSVELSIDPSVIALDDRRMVPGSPVVVHLTCSSLSDGVVVEGTVSGEFHGECRRCLSEVVGRVDVDVRELYQVVRTDPDAFPIENDQIDLVPMVRESLLLELPDAPVCRPDCRGLCPACGTDLNSASCSCTIETRDPRWAALDDLRDRLPE